MSVHTNLWAQSCCVSTHVSFQTHGSSFATNLWAQCTVLSVHTHKLVGPVLSCQYKQTHGPSVLSSHVSPHKLGPVTCPVMSVHTNLWAQCTPVMSVHKNLWVQCAVLSCPYTHTHGFSSVMSGHTNLWAQFCHVSTVKFVGPEHCPGPWIYSPAH